MCVGGVLCRASFSWTAKPDYWHIMTKIYSPLSRLSTARGIGMRFSLVGSTKVKAYKSFMLTQKSPLVENSEHLFCCKKENSVQISGGFHPLSKVSALRKGEQGWGVVYC